ncbi:MAG: putative porin, partial [Kangiellaceae bacterium]|nr:putative porin [Kangiellaceae bacterium]
FTDNMMFGATYAESVGLASASFGYLFSDDFIVQVTAFDDDVSFFDFNLSATYNHQMGDDYIGFNFNTDEEFELPTVSTKYFNNMGNGQYLTATLSISDLDDDRDAAAGVGYYFNERQSIDVFYAEGGFYTLEYQHFFNRNFALDVAYSDEDDLDGEIIRVGLTIQL